MSIYDTKIRQSEEFKNSSQKTVQISRKDKKSIDLDEIVKLSNGLMKVGDTQNKKTSLLIRGECNAGWRTLKAFDDDIGEVDDYLDYFSNNVKSTKKFENFYQLQVTIISFDKNIVNRKDLNHQKVKHPEEKKITKTIFDKPKSKK